MDKKKTWPILVVLAIIGIGLASYLFYNYLVKPPTSLCYINSKLNCDAVTQGVLSTMFGLPVPLIGLTGYVVILISSLIKNKKIVLGMASFGMIFCFYLTIQDVFVLRIVCPVCLACQLDMLLVFLFSLQLNLLTHKPSLKKKPKKDQMQNKK